MPRSSRHARWEMGAGGVYVPPIVYSHPTVASLVAHWSGNIGTVSEVPNRAGGDVGALVQPTAADQPSIITLTGGVKALRFDGTTDDMFTPDVAALRFSPKGFWGMHLRIVGSPTGRLFSQWGASERIEFNYINNTRFESRVATSPIALAQRNYAVTAAAVTAGLWVYQTYDGTNGTTTDRHKLFKDGVDTATSGSAGTMPATLQTGDATEFWLASLNGGSNVAVDVAHFYICNDVPSAGEIIAMRDFEIPNWS